MLLYYLVIKPLSLLPLWVLYRVSDVGYLVMFHLIGYRKRVVFDNIRKAFPDKTAAEVDGIARRFYRHLCDMLMESIQMFSVSEAEAKRRCVARNAELLHPYFERGQTVLVGFGHYSSWERTMVLPFVMKHHVRALFTPLSSSFFNGKILASRQRMGAFLHPKKDVKKILNEEKETPSLLFFGTDQNPSPRSGKLFWTTFLGRETAVNFGLEKYAKDYGCPVAFIKIRRLRRGYYEYHFEFITDHPRELPHGAITIAHTRLLEEQIREEPAYWLWSHKRWKRTRKAGEKLYE